MDGVELTVILSGVAIIVLVGLVVTFGPRMGGKPNDSVDTGGRSAADID
jgi:hypothetical protein